ncbi:hypothetical protein RFI_22678, partial [Reticulomyxa filosa]
MIHYIILGVFLICPRQLIASLQDARIVDGTPTDGKTFPYMASLYAEKKNSKINFCGGALIKSTNPAIVLTAGHCLYGDEKNDVRAKNPGYTMKADIGRTSLKDDEETGYETLIWKDLYIHSKFNATTLENDIGLILMEN